MQISVIGFFWWYPYRISVHAKIPYRYSSSINWILAGNCKNFFGCPLVEWLQRRGGQRQYLLDGELFYIASAIFVLFICQQESSNEN